MASCFMGMGYLVQFFSSSEIINSGKYFNLGDFYFMRKYTLITLLLVFLCSCASLPTTKPLEPPKLGMGFSFDGTPYPIALPPGHPDFTLWPIVQYTWVSPEVSMVRVAKPGLGCYELLSCENIALILALHHSCGDDDYYWIYKDKLPVKATKAEFGRKIIEAQYLCVGVKSEEV